MKILNSLTSPHLPSRPIALTIGNFDGVHLGHQTVLDKINAYASSHNGESVAISFTNHPSSVLRPDQKVCQICALDHKTSLLKKAGIDYLILLTFTKELSEHTAEEFIQKVRRDIPFNYLILGHDATLGKDRQGDRKKMEALASEMRFEVHYLPEQAIGGERISSTKIRHLIQKGEFLHVSKLLGRDYSIYSKVVSGKKIGKQIGFPTANLSVGELCLPPLGVYAVRVRLEDRLFLGAANLGYAPTVRHDPNPLLEVFLFDADIDLYDQLLEVIFVAYLRPEVKFESIDALKAQIQGDISEAKKMLNYDRNLS